jgi:hypothetical protein
MRWEQMPITTARLMGTACFGVADGVEEFYIARDDGWTLWAYAFGDKSDISFVCHVRRNLTMLGWTFFAKTIEDVQAAAEKMMPGFLASEERYLDRVLAAVKGTDRRRSASTK